MPQAALPLPPPRLAADGTLRMVRLKNQRLIRISRISNNEPYFGASGANRFDAPGCEVGAPEFRTCYFGLSLEVAVAETILHDQIPVEGQFILSYAEISRHYVHLFSGERLMLLELSGATLKRLAGHAELAGSASTLVTQQWSLAVFKNPRTFDGFIYMSRHLNTQRAVVLFDRAHSKLQPCGTPIPLPEARGARLHCRPRKILHHSELDSSCHSERSFRRHPVARAANRPVAETRAGAPNRPSMRPSPDRNTSRAA